MIVPKVRFCGTLNLAREVSNYHDQIVHACIVEYDDYNYCFFSISDESSTASSEGPDDRVQPESQAEAKENQLNELGDPMTYSMYAEYLCCICVNFICFSFCF